jgi:hypothetical protein
MKLWITYAWNDNKEGDFDYLVQELRRVGIVAEFDRVALVPGQRLWEQISDRITNGNIDGWAYLITNNSINSQPCLEELEYAVNRAVATKAGNFPLIGLIHNVSFSDVPVSLKARLCVPLANPDWVEQVTAGLQLRAPYIISTPQTRFICRTYEKYNGVGKSAVVEIRPRFEEVMYWRIIVPLNAKVTKWGFGPANGEDNVAGVMTDVTEGTQGEVHGKPVTIFGAGDRLSASIAAKVIFQDAAPEFVAFGLATEPFGMPAQVEFYQISS